MDLVLFVMFNMCNFIRNLHEKYYYFSKPAFFLYLLLITCIEVMNKIQNLNATFKLIISKIISVKPKDTGT